MIEKATKSGFERHLAETRNDVRRVERVFEMHGVEIGAVNCPAIDGIIKEASDVAGEVDDKQVLDAALLPLPRPSNTMRSPVMDRLSHGPSSSGGRTARACCRKTLQKKRQLTKS